MIGGCRQRTSRWAGVRAHCRAVSHGLAHLEHARGRNDKKIAVKCLSYSWFDERREFRYQNDSHFKREGHQALAVSLAPVIERIMAVHGGLGGSSEDANAAATCEP